MTLYERGLEDLKQDVGHRASRIHVDDNDVETWRAESAPVRLESQNPANDRGLALLLCFSIRYDPTHIQQKLGSVVHDAILNRVSHASPAYDIAARGEH